VNTPDEENEPLQDDLLDFAIIGASLMAHGLTDFPRWSKAMLNEGDASIRPFLSMLFHNSKCMLERVRTAEAKSSSSQGASMQIRDSSEQSSEVSTLREELAAAEERMDVLLKGFLQSGSAQQVAFATLYKLYRATNPAYFEDPEWIDKLQAESKKRRL
jgi:hypothetical protein